MEENSTVDVIMASFAQDENLKQITLNAVQSLLASEDQRKIRFNIVILESQKSLQPYQYPGTTTVYPDEPFGYHRYLNIGIKQTSSPYICICNNDLVFKKNWATEILKPFQRFTDVYSASPFCTVHHPNEGFKMNNGFTIGYRVRKEMAGWCIFFRRDLLTLIGTLDPNYVFWCADNDYANTLYCLKLNHILVTTSFVDHLESKTLEEQTEDRKLQITEGETIYYKKKWNPRMGDEWVAIE